MTTNTAVVDLTVACVTSVKNASGMELDLTQDTLPILDHYAELIDSPRDEIVSLQAAPEDQLRVQKALEVFGDVRDRDYYTFTMRFEAIEQAYLGLLNNPAGMAPQP
jgi:hypothetical protein